MQNWQEHQHQDTASLHHPCSWKLNNAPTTEFIRWCKAVSCYTQILPESLHNSKYLFKIQTGGVTIIEMYFLIQETHTQSQSKLLKFCRRKSHLGVTSESRMRMCCTVSKGIFINTVSQKKSKPLLFCILFRHPLISMRCVAYIHKTVVIW